MPFVFFYSCTGRWAGLSSAQIIDRAFLRGWPSPALPEILINTPNYSRVIFSASSTIHQGRYLGCFRIEKRTEIGWVSIAYQKVYADNAKHFLTASGERIVFNPSKKIMDYSLKFWREIVSPEV